jgi:hypothetical protein
VKASIETSQIQSNGSYSLETSRHISAIRQELKSKHSRHIQDLKEYYEKEMEELRNQLKTYQNNKTQNNKSIDEQNETDGAGAAEKNTNYNNQIILNNELKVSNNALLNKLVIFCL